MNGPRKYKVTIRVVDHPSSETASIQNRLSVEKKEQKTEPSLNDNTFSSGIKSVHKSSVSWKVSDIRSHSCVRNSCCCASPKGLDQRQTCTKSERHDRILNNEDMLDSEFYECTKPLLRTDKTASLNINKLTRSNAIDEEELEEPNEINNIAIASSECGRPVKFSTSGKQSSQTCSSADSKTSYGLRKPKNGFTLHLPIVVLNSTTMEEDSHEQNIVTNNALGNGIQDDFLPEFEGSETREDRPPLNREGSACSSDSIITEIEGLTDDESDLKSCSNADCDNQEVYI